ncbi:MAG: S9 family peptidase, partial [Proteobacteria bacterium]|nr:S9 family peptidase [Pseudomonadota bacterium]
ADINELVVRGASGRPLAAGAMFERQRWRAVDPAFAADLKAIRAATAGDLYFSQFSADGRKVIVYSERDTASPEYALYDRGTRRLRPLLKARKTLDGVALRPLEAVSFRARDGLTIPCYLTLPETGARNAPMVLAIHGGPYARDQWGYWPTHQWLANRGYAVLSVNYRGSTGFGKAFVTAADREWGGKMHDDLIDAVDWAVARGIADPKRVGFYGASYGGYSALTAATKTPEAFACIVDIFGIANLLTFMAAIPPYWSPWFSVWKNRLGDPDTDEGQAFLKARSPLTHIDRAFRPILIAQGRLLTPGESDRLPCRHRGVPGQASGRRD